jgi:hypothetical protein
MATLGNNVEDTVHNMLRFIMRYFEGTNLHVKPDELVFKLNRDYFDVEVNPQMLQVAYAAMMEGNLPQVSWFELLKRARVVRGDMSKEEFDEHIAELGFGM